MSVTSGVHIRPRLVDFRVDGKSRCVDGLFADDDFSVFVDKDEITHADLGEVSGKRVEPCEARLEYTGFNRVHLLRSTLVLTEMIRQNRITHTDMPSNTLIKPSLGKDSISGREMLFAIQALILEVVEHRVRSHSQWLA
jgi:hypothetical protein